MQKLQQLKKIRLGQDPDPNMENNLLSLTIQSNMIFLTIQVPKERFNGTSDPADHAATDKSQIYMIFTFI